MLANHATQDCALVQYSILHIDLYVMPCYFYIMLLQVFATVNVFTYSCIDMCEHTNHIRSHDHPKQMLLC